MLFEEITLHSKITAKMLALTQTEVSRFGPICTYQNYLVNVCCLVSVGFPIDWVSHQFQPQKMSDNIQSRLNTKTKTY